MCCEIRFQFNSSFNLLLADSSVGFVQRKLRTKRAPQRGIRCYHPFLVPERENHNTSIRVSFWRGCLRVLTSSSVIRRGLLVLEKHHWRMLTNIPAATATMTPVATQPAIRNAGPRVN